jgi:hypothetical protein
LDRGQVTNSAWLTVCGDVGIAVGMKCLEINGENTLQQLSLALSWWDWWNTVFSF